MQLLDINNTRKGRKYKMMKLLLESTRNQVLEHLLVPAEL